MKKSADGQDDALHASPTRNKTVDVVYRGLLPDLFREGQGVVAEGSLGADGVFVAREILAKHDENYMPPEVAKAMKDSGPVEGREEVSVPSLEPAPSAASLQRAASLAEAAPALASRSVAERDVMIPELGHFALILALAVALVQGTLPLLGASRGDIRLMDAGPHRRAHAGASSSSSPSAR